MSYDIVFYNDYDTSLRFILAVLVMCLGYTSLAALKKAGHMGFFEKAVVATFARRSVARMKAEQIKKLAQSYGYPLKICVQSRPNK